MAKRRNYMAFTSSSFAYGSTKEEATVRLKDELETNKNNLKRLPTLFGVSDVSGIGDDVEIIIEAGRLTTEDGTELEVEIERL